MVKGRDKRQKAKGKEEKKREEIGRCFWLMDNVNYSFYGLLEMFEVKNKDYMCAQKSKQRQLLEELVKKS